MLETIKILKKSLAEGIVVKDVRRTKCSTRFVRNMACRARSRK